MSEWTIVCRQPECLHEWRLAREAVKPGLRCPKCLRPRPVAYPDGQSPAELRRAKRKTEEAKRSNSIKANKKKADEIEAARKPVIPHGPAAETIEAEIE